MGKTQKVNVKHSKKNQTFGVVIGVLTSIIVLISLVMLGHQANRETILSGPKESLVIGYGVAPESALAILALDQNYFSLFGLDVIVKEYPSGIRALQDGLFSGEIDIAITSEVPIVLNSFSCSDFSIVASIGYSDNEPRIIARSDAGIKEPVDLKGKRIATQPDSAVHYFLHLFLLENGLSEKDIELSFMNAEALPKAFASGEIDAFSMREPFISEAIDLLEEKAVVFEMPGIYLKTSNVVSLNSYIASNPQIIDCFLRSMIKAEEYIQKNPQEAMKIVAKRLGMAEERLNNVWKDIIFRVTLDQALLLSLENEARWAIRAEIVTGTALPNYLEYIHLYGLNSIRPKAVTIIR